MFVCSYDECLRTMVSWGIRFDESDAKYDNAARFLSFLGENYFGSLHNQAMIFGVSFKEGVMLNYETEDQKKSGPRLIGSNYHQILGENKVGAGDSLKGAMSASYMLLKTDKDLQYEIAGRELSDAECIELACQAGQQVATKYVALPQEITGIERFDNIRTIEPVLKIAYTAKKYSRLPDLLVDLDSAAA
jgi:hypothetical protein